MSAGRIALLLVAGGLAGAAFAAMTTGSMASFTAPTHSRSIAPDTAPQQRSWLDEGLSALDSPAWPFGHDEAQQPPAPPPDGYAPYGYGPPDDYDDGAWENRQYGARDPYPDDREPPAYRGDAPAVPPAPQDDSDSAADAAARAADAAQDVIAAEKTP